MKEQEYETLIHQAEDWLRRALLLILRDPDYGETFRTSTRRDKFMDRLVLGLEDDADEADGQE